MPRNQTVILRYDAEFHSIIPVGGVTRVDVGWKPVRLHTKKVMPYAPRTIVRDIVTHHCIPDVAVQWHELDVRTPFPRGYADDGLIIDRAFVLADASTGIRTGMGTIMALADRRSQPAWFD